MTALDRLLIAANLAMVATAAGVHLWAAAQLPFRRERVRHIGIGMLATGYAFGYVALLAGWVPVLVWSSFFRGVSLLVWPLVWIAPAISQARTWRGVSDDAREIVRRAEELGEPARERHRADG